MDHLYILRKDFLCVFRIVHMYALCLLRMGHQCVSFKWTFGVLFQIGHIVCHSEETALRGLGLDHCKQAQRKSLPYVLKAIIEEAFALVNPRQV